MSLAVAALAACGGPGHSDGGTDAASDVAMDHSAAPDTGTDAGVPADTGTDAVSPDAVSPPDVVGTDVVDASPPDAGTDAGMDAGTDAGTDAAADAGTDAASSDVVSPTDGATPTYSFASPLQVDLSSVLDVDTVASSAASGRSYPPLVSMDASGYDFFTASVGMMSGDAAGGLPDDGFFASNSDHPDVHLAFSDTTAGNNTVILNVPPALTPSVTFPITAASFTRVQVYMTSTEGSATVAVTLHYTDSTTSMTSFTVPDWFDSSSAGAPVFVVASGLSRYSDAGGVDFSHGAALYGANVNTAGTTPLNSVTVAVTAGTGRLAIYGATAY